MREKYGPLLEIAVRHGFKELASGVSLPHTLAEVALVGYLSGSGMSPEQALKKVERKEYGLLGGREAHERGLPDGEKLEGEVVAPLTPPVGPGAPVGPAVGPGAIPVAPVPFGAGPWGPAPMPVAPGVVSPGVCGCPPAPVGPGFPFGAPPVGPMGAGPFMLPQGAVGGPGAFPPGAPGLWDGFRPLDP